MTNIYKKSPEIKEQSEAGKFSKALSRQALDEKLNLKNARAAWLLGLGVAVVLLVVLAVNLWVYLNFRNFNVEKVSIQEEFKEVTHQLSIFATDLTKMRESIELMALRSQDNNFKAKQLEEALEVKSAAIDNLIKAKENIFKRVSALESKETVQQGLTPSELQGSQK